MSDSTPNLTTPTALKIKRTLLLKSSKAFLLIDQDQHWQIFSLKEQRANTLDFAGHLQSLLCTLLCFLWVWFCFFNDYLKMVGRGKLLSSGCIKKAVGQRVWTLGQHLLSFLIKENIISRDPKNYSKISEKCYTMPSLILIDILRNNQHRELNLCEFQFPQE